MPSAPETVVDLSSLNLHPGAGKRIELPVQLAPFELGGQTYLADPSAPQMRLEASRHSSGFAFKLNFAIHIEGPCMRCLEHASLDLDVEALNFDIEQPYQVHDLLSDQRYQWRGARNYVMLDPERLPAHLFKLRRHLRSEHDFDYYL